MHYPIELAAVMAFFKKFPGVGSKTAERLAFQLLGWSEDDVRGFSEQLRDLKEKIKHCTVCQCLLDGETCRFCDHERRDPSLLCVVATARDVYSLEQTHTYKGLYHVIGGLLSPLDGRSPSHLFLDPLKKRVIELSIKEVIIALDSTLEGDTTALYIKEQLEPLGTTVSRLAFGIPIGSSLDFVDGGTLSRALTGRQHF
jgi:recombination protein RecR